MKSKKIFTKFACILLIIVSLLSLFSCKKNRKYNEEEVIAAAKELIAKSVVLDEIYYGRGILYSDDLTYANGIYRKALDDYMEQQSFSTLEELKAMTAEVYTQDLCNMIFSTKLSSVSDEDGVQFMSRYYQKYEDDLSDVPAYIMVNSEYENYLTDTVEYCYDTIGGTYAEGEKVYVTVCARVTNGEGETQERSVTLPLLEEASGWRLDCSTYLKYNDSIEKYEKLQESE